MNESCMSERVGELQPEPYLEGPHFYPPSPPLPQPQMGPCVFGSCMHPDQSYSPSTSPHPLPEIHPHPQPTFSESTSAACAESSCLRMMPISRATDSLAEAASRRAASSSLTGGRWGRRCVRGRAGGVGQGAGGRNRLGPRMGPAWHCGSGRQTGRHCPPCQRRCCAPAITRHETPTHWRVHAPDLPLILQIGGYLAAALLRGGAAILWLGGAAADGGLGRKAHWWQGRGEQGFGEGTTARSTRARGEERHDRRQQQYYITQASYMKHEPQTPTQVTPKIEPDVKTHAQHGRTWRRVAVP